MTKGAVSAMVPALARELGPLGISVNGVAPGLVIHPDAGRNLDKMEALGAEGASPEEAQALAVAKIMDRLNVERPGTPEDVAYAVVFLASRASDYISGQMLVVDGGSIVT